MKKKKARNIIVKNEKGNVVIPLSLAVFALFFFFKSVYCFDCFAIIAILEWMIDARALSHIYIHVLIHGELHPLEITLVERQFSIELFNQNRCHALQVVFCSNLTTVSWRKTYCRWLLSFFCNLVLLTVGICYFRFCIPWISVVSLFQ